MNAAGSQLRQNRVILKDILYGISANVCNPNTKSRTRNYGSVSENVEHVLTRRASCEFAEQLISVFHEFGINEDLQRVIVRELNA